MFLGKDMWLQYKVLDDKLAIVQIAVSNKNIVDAEAYAWLEFL